MTATPNPKIERTALKALAATADWHDAQTKPPTVHRIWQRIHHECHTLTCDIAQGDLYPSVLGEAFRLLRQAADCSRQTYLSAVLNGHRKHGNLGTVLHHAAGRQYAL
jgi:hypothetical protein